MNLKKLHDEAVAASAAYTAAAVIATATDCGDDPTTYALDSAELVTGYLVDMAEDVAARLPAAVRAALGSTPSVAAAIDTLMEAIEAECKGKDEHTTLGFFEDLIDEVESRTTVLYRDLTGEQSSSPKAK